MAQKSSSQKPVPAPSQDYDTGRSVPAAGIPDARPTNDDRTETAKQGGSSKGSY